MIAKDRAIWNRVQSMSRMVAAALASAPDDAPGMQQHVTKARAGITPAATLGALRDARALQQTIDEWQLLAVKGARMADVPWAEIAAAAGISRQAAWERWHEITAPLESPNAS